MLRFLRNMWREILVPRARHVARQTPRYVHCSHLEVPFEHFAIRCPKSDLHFWIRFGRKPLHSSGELAVGAVPSPLSYSFTFDDAPAVTGARWILSATDCAVPG